MSNNRLLFPKSKSYEKSKILLSNIVHSSEKILVNYVVNYVATIKGHFNDIKKAKELVNKNQLKEYEKRFRPVYLRIMSVDGSTKTELYCKRINSNTDRLLKVRSIEGDSDNIKYFYIVSLDSLEENRSRTHIMCLLNKPVIESIRSDWKTFSDPMDMLIMNYSIPQDTDSIIRSVQVNCLAECGHFVNKMKKTMSQPLHNIFMKRGLLPINVLASKRYKNKTSSNSGVLLYSHTPVLRNSLHRRLLRLECEKSRSIENLLLTSQDNGLFEPNTEGVLPSNYNNRFQSGSNEMTNKKLASCSFMKKSNSQMSLNTASTNAMDSSFLAEKDDSWFYKFDNVINNASGILHFTKFLRDEFSSENIEFWKAINEFSKLEDSELLKREAQRIFYMFVHSSSETPVNLEYHTTELIKQRLAEPTASMYNEAKSHVYQLMKSDSFNRFLISNHFLRWKDGEQQATSQMKPAVSSSSLNQRGKRRSFLPAFLKGSRSKLSRDNSRKSSAQTLDSDVAINGSNSSLCTIQMMTYVAPVAANVSQGDKSSDRNLMAVSLTDIFHVQDRQNKKLGTVLKKLSKSFNESNYTVFNVADNKIVLYNESMLNLHGQKLAVEHNCMLRLGLIQDSLDTVIYENIWFVLRPRASWPLSSVLDGVVKKFQHSLNSYVVIDEEFPTDVLPWDSVAYNYNKRQILLIEKILFKKAKFNCRVLPTVHNNLWKKMQKDEMFLMSLPCDQDNCIDSREAFPKFHLEPRRIGYISSKSMDDKALYDSIKVTKSNSNSQHHLLDDLEDQRADLLNNAITTHLIGSSQTSKPPLDLPEFLRQDYQQQQQQQAVVETSTWKLGVDDDEEEEDQEQIVEIQDPAEESDVDLDVELSWNSSSMKRFSTITNGGRTNNTSSSLGDGARYSSECSFSELDDEDNSLPSPSRFELVSDFEF